MHEDPLIVRNHVCPFDAIDSTRGIEIIDGELAVGKDVPPVTLAIDPTAGFIGMGYRGLEQGLTDWLQCLPGFLISLFDDVGQSAFAQGAVEEFP